MKKYRCLTSQENGSQVLQITPAWLLGVLFISLALLTNTIETSSVPHQGTEMKAKVVIVGAGVSGIAAANKLLQNGITDVTILEAMDRIGGRIHYKQLGGDFGGVDLGGHWVHGQEKNILYELAEPLGLVGHSGDSSNQEFFRSDGVQVEIPNTIMDLYDRITEGADNYTNGNTYEDLTNEEVERFGKENNLSEEDTKALQGYMKLSLCAFEACQDLADVSLKTASVFQKAEGDWLIEWKTGGMANALHLLMGTHEKSPWKGLGVDKKVKLSSRVAKIDWSSQDSVSITTDSGSSHSADFVIVTSSLNVLKKKHKAMFTPSLPQPKVNAIEALGMDAVDKVYLAYSKPWWPKDVSSFNLLHPNEFTSETQDLGEAIIAFAAENHNPHVLGVWFIGRGAKVMETKTEDEVQEAIMKTLKQYLGKKYTITEPDMIVRSRWWNTEDVGGSYTYNSVASDKLDDPRGSLAEPLSNNDGKPMVLFAGEATNRIHFSTVHGALETGWREAERIIQYLKNKNN